MLRPSFFTILGLGSFGFLLPLGQADQQAPSQHAPAMHEYQELKTDGDSKKDDQLTSTVTLTWRAIPLAGRYLLKVSHDPEGTSIVYSVLTVNLTHVTPELAPGGYYYVVEGYEDERRVGQSVPQPFVVGKPLALDAKKERMPAPTIIGPKHMDLYPTYGYVRLAWQGVEGARGYRFRLWNEDKVKENHRWKRDTPPRWITEVKNPWIEVHDAPYTSFMYLETGTYRWDVAAVDADGGYLGDTAMGYFRTSRQWFFKPNEIFLSAEYGFYPQEVYYQDSSVTGTQSKLLSSSHRLNADLDWWFWRQWGVNLGGGFQSLSLTSPSGQNPADTIFFVHANADLLFRTYLSTVPWGWWLVLSAGFGMQEFPQVDTFSASQGGGSIHVERPKAMGAKFGIQLHKRWNNWWEAQFNINSLVHAFTTTSPTGSSVTHTPIDLDLAFKVLLNWSNHFGTYASLGGEVKRAQYTPQPFGANSNVLLQGIVFAWGFQFNYYPPPNNLNYYPDHDGAYYPADKTKSYYHSEERTIDRSNKDSSSWQRWRPR
ncbi:MAG: hypothetical protein HY074_10315 [Deltaproteobacteria bacterium]|nr:hypothetical protein [Deltaproteobacteria bacterium]